MEEDFFTKVGTDKIGHHAGQTMAVSAHLIGNAPSDAHQFQALAAHGAWAENDGKFWCTAQSHDTLPVGFYKMDVSPNVGPLFIAMKNDTDDLMVFPDSESEAVLREIKVFKTLKPKFKAHGFLYKRGILLWGPPGSGKTTTLQLLVKLLMSEHDSVAVMVDHPAVAALCLQTLRRLEPDRQVVAIMEDLDAMVERHGESEFLSLLDGESQVDNIVYVATTNYPERLDRRFVDRPSRFDTIRYIGMPNAESRAAYLRAKLPGMDADTLHRYVAASDGYSVAHLRELIILTACFNETLETASARLNKSRQKISSDSTPDSRPVGFL